MELQSDNECIYCIVDEHAITVPQNPKELKTHILDVAALYLAVGVDPKKSIVFVQSQVSGHAAKTVRCGACGASAFFGRNRSLSS